MSKFKIGLLAVFSIFILVGVIVFALSRSDGKNILTGNALIWGTVDEEIVSNFLNSFKFDEKSNITATYVRKDQDTFDIELAEAIADGVGPDILLLSSDMLFKQKNKIFKIPYTNYTERVYKDTFVEQSEIFLDSDGILALPFMLDPLVMYWNRDIFRRYSLIEPPKFWDEFLTLAPKMAVKDTSGNITETAVSFGEWRNVSNAKSIISALLLQSGINVVDNFKNITLSNQIKVNNQPTTPAFSVLNFYTQFANPTNDTYSWNRSLPKSTDYFISQNLATYIGFSSELSNIRAKNPNLNFDVTTIPQPRQNKVKITFAKIYGLSILKQSKNIPASFAVLNSMTANKQIADLEKFTNLPPIRKDLLSNIPSDSYKSVFYKSAIFAKGWMDIDRKKTDDIFKEAIESVTSGRNSVTEALSQAFESLSSLYNK
jgi:ABC-type glycerol-3-phosphate transport system substrate-binding protein